MKLRRITSLREFDDLLSVWGEITGNRRSPFLSHDWFACCWRTAGANRGREVWLFEDAAGPLALIPLVRSKARIRWLPARVVQFLDAPEAPFSEFPVARDLDDVLTRFLTALGEQRDWDVLSLPKLRTDSLASHLEALLPGRLQWQPVSRTLSPFVTAEGTWDTYLGRRPPEIQEAWQRYSAHLGTSGLIIEEHRQLDPQGPVFTEMMELFCHGGSAEMSFIIATQAAPRFFRELTVRAGVQGWLRLWMLRHNGRAIATEYQLVDERASYALRSRFDSAFAALSPDLCLSLSVTRALFAQNKRAAYYLDGVSPHTLGIATEALKVVDFRAYAPTMYGRLLHQADRHPAGDKSAANGTSAL